MAVDARAVAARQRALIQELSYGTLRWYFRLDAMLGQLLRKPLKQRDADLHCLLLTGLYQLDQLAMPQRVAVHETVQATRSLDKDWATGLVNGVLRNYQRRAAVLEAAICEKSGDLRKSTGLPCTPWLVDRLLAVRLAGPLAGDSCRQQCTSPFQFAC